MFKVIVIPRQFERAHPLNPVNVFRWRVRATKQHFWRCCRLNLLANRDRYYPNITALHLVPYITTHKTNLRRSDATNVRVKSHLLYKVRRAARPTNYTVYIVYRVARKSVQWCSVRARQSKTKYKKFVKKIISLTMNSPHQTFKRERTHIPAVADQAIGGISGGGFSTLSCPICSFLVTKRPIKSR